MAELSLRVAGPVLAATTPSAAAQKRLAARSGYDWPRLGCAIHLRRVEIAAADLGFQRSTAPAGTGKLFAGSSMVRCCAKVIATFEIVVFETTQLAASSRDGL